MGKDGLSLGLSPFFRHEPLPTTSPRTSSHSGMGNPFESLSIQDHNGRSSYSFAFQEAAANTPPLSPAASTFTALYPLAPHLTPQASPSSSPRSSSPLQLATPSPGHDHPLPTTHLLGKLTIKVVEARDLGVSSNQERPYCLLQYDQTDSVSREFGASLSGKGHGESKRGLKRGRGVARPGLRQTQSFTVRRRVGDSKEEAVEGSSPKSQPAEAPPEGDEKDIGTPRSPIWNHSACFDVVHPGRTILLCVYDKLAPVGGFPAHGFLGAVVLEPPLTAEMGQDGEGHDVWVPLTSALDPRVGGEVRLRILYEPLETGPKICVEDFHVLKKIGEGNFGQVFRVRKKDTKRIYAMKVISKRSAANKIALAQVLAERQVLALTLDSPFLVGLKFSFQSATDLFLVIDFKSGGELFNWLQKDGGRFEEAKVRFYVSEMILALDYLHKRGVIYRDLKPENVLLDGSGHCVLVDFGLSKLLTGVETSTKTICGTTSFIAPEVLLDVGYDYRCDWWSLGVLMFEMCYGWSPFYSENRIEEYERILTSEIKIPSKKGYCAENRDLLLRFLTREPSERIGTNGATEIQSHPFFSSVDWAKAQLRQISPPFKPPTYADEDTCDYYDRGRGGEWMFSGDGECWTTGGVRAKENGNGRNGDDMDCEGGLWRDFTFVGGGGGGGGEEANKTISNGRRSSWNGVL